MSDQIMEMMVVAGVEGPDDSLGYLYRYEDVKYSRGCDEFDNPYPGYDLKVELHKYRITRRTPKGAWISLSGFPGHEKFVLLDARKKFACETGEDAMESFRRRKQKQAKILEGQLKRVQWALKLADNMEPK